MLRWTYPKPTREVMPYQLEPIAELWDSMSGMRRAIVVRADAWPEKSYRIVTPDAEGRFLMKTSDVVDMQGDFLQAQALALSLAVVS